MSRRLAGAGLAAVIAVAGLVALIAFFSGRDEPALERAAPGEPAPALDRPELRAGNVVLRYADPADRSALERLARSLDAAATPALVDAGQAVVVRSGAQAGVVAEALGRRMAVASPADPQLERFVQHFLGRGAS